MYYHPHFTKEKMGPQKENHTDSKWQGYCQTKLGPFNHCLVWSPSELTAKLHPLLVECLNIVEGTLMGLGGELTLLVEVGVGSMICRFLGVILPGSRIPGFRGLVEEDPSSPFS